MQSKRPTLSAIKFDPQLWRHPEGWPHDPLNYVFLARAFQEIGRARYGDEWTDRCIEPEEPPTIAMRPPTNSMTGTVRKQS